MTDGAGQYSIAMAAGFIAELNRAPRNVQNAVRNSWPLLEDHPPTPSPPKIKRLNGYKGLWRLRVSDSYRLVYRIDSDGRFRTVTLLMLGKRSDIYDRLGANEDGSPGVQILTDDVAELIEREPTPEEIIEAFSDDEPPQVVSPDEPIPMKLESALLDDWGVDPKYHGAFGAVGTEGELLALIGIVPADVLEYVLNCLLPPPIEQVVQQPVLVLDEAENLEHATDGVRSLDSFLLKLDEDQRTFVGRFDRDVPRGPWLLKGGPGSGKSIVALYCIRELIDRESRKLPGQQKKLSILFTTYTNSLIRASRHVLKAIGALDGGHKVRIDTLDTVVWDFLPADMRRLSPVTDSSALPQAEDAIVKCIGATERYPFGIADAPYLIEEVDWVIVGQNLTTRDEYVETADRKGRKRALGKRQREHVWAFYEAFRRELREKGKCLFTERQQGALSNAKPVYDYVFLDEAQDLRPVAIRFAVALAKPDTNVFITADSNQSIYGTGMAWSKVGPNLDVRGRAQILKRNYRTTHEIWDAVKQLAPAPEDAETLEVEPVYHGSPPILVRHNSMTKLGIRLNDFLFESMRAERVGPDSVAILCPTGRAIDEILPLIDKSFKAKKMNSKSLKIDYPGVTLTTMHASKGLGYPIVVIAGVDEGRLPWAAPVGIDREDHEARQHRLLFVAGTRAMKRLLIATDDARPSPFLDGVTDDYWEIETV